MPYRLHPTRDGWDHMKPAVPAGEEYDGCRTVGQEADLAELAILVFTDAKVEPEIEEYHASDLITSILHYADSRGWRMEDVVERGMNHYLAET